MDKRCERKKRVKEREERKRGREKEREREQEKEGERGIKWNKIAVSFLIFECYY